MPPTQTEELSLPIQSEGTTNLNGCTADNNAAKSEDFLLPLSPLDALMQKLGVILLYIFPRPPSAKYYDLSKLQRAFITLVDKDYPILIGQLYVDSQTGVVSVKQTIESRLQGARIIRFETNSSSSVTTEDAMKTLSLDLLPTPRNPMELICVKGTVLSDGGLVIGVDASHALLDGEAMFTFMKAWGRYYSGTSEQDRMLINHDRHLLGGTGSPSKQVHPEFRLLEVHTVADGSKFETTTTASVPPPTTQHRFHFTLEMMKRIKEIATRGNASLGLSDPSYVSTIDAITGIFTALISRARGYGQDVKVITAVNARGRLNPPLPPNYFGNVIFSALSSYGSDELLNDIGNGGMISQDMLARLAQRVRSSIRQSDNDYLRDAIDYITEQTNLSAIQPAINAIFGPDIVYTSWVHTGMYDAKFEDTHPCMVSIPSLPFDGFVIITEASKGISGIDVQVFLECVAMKKLQELFLQVGFLHD
ncbi:unnamed protein product [Peronospora belbahrii]|uniref:Transferase n=1 Tax=Peronospora belbahrii TaxID=622444 RepID=A0AAU9LSU2_9STRA|nr:unnamed protein product [Peronospora belbahrii]